MTEEFFLEMQNKVQDTIDTFNKLEKHIIQIDKVNQKTTEESKLYQKIKKDLDKLFELLEF